MFPTPFPATRSSSRSVELFLLAPRTAVNPPLLRWRIMTLGANGDVARSHNRAALDALVGAETSRLDTRSHCGPGANRDPQGAEATLLHRTNAEGLDSRSRSVSR
jgi:hypothetical protein